MTTALRSGPSTADAAGVDRPLDQLCTECGTVEAAAERCSVCGSATGEDRWFVPPPPWP